MAGSSVEQWHDFFIGGAGTSAALAGLAIVAISVNVQPILSQKHLPSRAAATIATFTLILVISMSGLVPDKGLRNFGFEVLVFTLACWVLQFRAAYQMRLRVPDMKYGRYELAVDVVISHLHVVLLFIAAVLMIAEVEGGLQWMASGIITAFILGMVNSWVLLIEILR